MHEGGGRWVGSNKLVELKKKKKKMKLRLGGLSGVSRVTQPGNLVGPWGWGEECAMLPALSPHSQQWSPPWVCVPTPTVQHPALICTDGLLVEAGAHGAVA